MPKHTYRHVPADAAELAYEMPDSFDAKRLRHIPGGLEGLRKHHAAQLAKRSVVLAPDVAKLFPTAEAVNAALRLVAQLSATVKPRRKKSA